MAIVLLITSSGLLDPCPMLDRSRHQVIVRTPRDHVLAESASCDVVVVDARSEPVAAKTVCQMFTTAHVAIPRLVILNLEDLDEANPSWGCADFLVAGCSPGELGARLGRLTTGGQESGPHLGAGGLVIDEAGYSVWLNGATLDLTYTEFELLKYLAHHRSQVFSREQLLTQVWGHDYYGGTRTVDVHIRRLRAKLGPEHESLIQTVRNVGYRFAGDNR